jgi:hypothetical protein
VPVSGFGTLIQTKEETNMATTGIAMAPMKAAQISKLGADFEIVEREIPKPAVRCTEPYISQVGQAYSV